MTCSFWVSKCETTGIAIRAWVRACERKVTRGAEAARRASLRTRWVRMPEARNLSRRSVHVSLSADLGAGLDAYRRAANDLSVG